MSESEKNEERSKETLVEVKKICFVTGTRAEYGIMSGLIKRFRDDKRFILQVVATNMHLSPEFGMTVEEIERDGVKVDRRVEMLLSSDTPVGIVKSMGLCSIGIADVFDQLRPDMVVILGDRYEMLAVASAALIFNIPIAHLHGGEVTEGAIDDAIRNAITQMSTLHFASTEAYQKRIISMGADSNNVYNAGSLAAESIASFIPLSREALNDSLGLELADKFISVTFHPVTLQPGEAVKQTQSLLDALDLWLKNNQGEGVKIVISLPNSDSEGRVIATQLKDWSSARAGEVATFSSLGRTRYYSLLSHAVAVVGNSSSGLLEAPSFCVPTVNIGDRQKGRARGNTVIDVDCERELIFEAINRATSEEFQSYCRREGVNPYYRPNTETIIFSAITDHLLS